MKSKVICLRMLLMALIVGMTFIGCDNGTTNNSNSGNTDPKTLVITNISPYQANDIQNSILIGVFIAGTTLEQVVQQIGVVAYAGDHDVTLSGNSAPYTATVELYRVDASGDTYWTGSGTYDVYISLGGSQTSGLQKQNVSFTSAITTVSITTFSDVSID